VVRTQLVGDQRFYGQCSIVRRGIGKSPMFAVANEAPTPTAAAAMRQSAWCNVASRTRDAKRCGAESVEQAPHGTLFARPDSAPDLLH
jgi:hypothetical protein